ncbi:tripartite tricarboxylate transporter substrate binding protein [Achromobacter aloeverae]
MDTQRRHLLRAGLALAAANGLAPATARAADYPSRPVELVHGFGAGGNADVVSRLVARQLAPLLGQPVIVEIKSGAGGRIASDFVAKARPDGQTLVMLTGAHTVSAVLTKSLTYDPVKDFTFLSTVSAFPFAIAVRADHPAKTLHDLLAMAAKAPDRITFTSVGVGSTQHMTGELLAATAGVKLLHVPYRGGGAPVEAVIAGDVDVLSDTLTVALPQVRAGRLRALAVTSANPWPGAPGIPTVAATLPGFEVQSWLGLAAPAGLPRAIVDTLNTDIRKALADDAARKTLASLGSEAAPSSPEAMRDMIVREIARWGDVARKANIPPQ